MDITILIEAYQCYIKSLKSRIDSVNIERNVSRDSSVSAKTITVYISNVSCIDNNVEIFDNTNIDVTQSSTKTKSPPTETNPLPSITHTFPNETSISRIVIRRPDCTSMLNAYVKICDGSNNCTYESVPIQSPRCIHQYYTYTIPNNDPCTR